jgi:hypothetical protein
MNNAGKSSFDRMWMAIGTVDYPTAQAKAILQKNQAVSREIETALAKIGKIKLSVPKMK